MIFSKAKHTNKISQDEAAEWFSYLKHHNEKFLKENYNWYLVKGYYPIKAKKKNSADKNPKFIVNHHTNGTKTHPAFARFATAKKASANFIVERSGNIIQMVDIHDQSYHATLNTRLSISARRALNIESRWLNEPGIETIGKGMKYLFRPEQFVSVICLQRYITAYYPSIFQLKSHKFFSPRSRSGDPGYLYFLPLVQHAVFNNIDLDDDSYWVKSYANNPVEFANNVKSWMKEYGVLENDEWLRYRNRAVNLKDNVLPEEIKKFGKTE